MTEYQKHLLSRPIFVQAIESANYVTGYINDVFHAHSDAWEFSCCLQGEISVSLADRTHRLSAGDVLFLPPHCSHRVHSDKPETAAYVISFVCSGDTHLRLLCDNVMPVNGPMLQILNQILDELKQAYLQEPDMHWHWFISNANSPFGSEQLISTYLEQFVIMLLRSVTMEHGKIVSGERFPVATRQYLAEQVISHIQNNLDQPISAETVAAIFHYSRTRLTAICKQVTGLGLNELITRERMESAKRLLADKNLSVSHISQQVGYTTPHYFSYKFKQYAGVSPSDYRDGIE